MEAKERIIIVEESRLKVILAPILAEILDTYLKYRQSAVVTHSKPSSRVDFDGLRREYYPGIPASTVRQDTVRLSRTKVGRRNLFDRDEVEEHLREKRIISTCKNEHEAQVQFALQHQRRGGRKVV